MWFCGLQWCAVCCSAAQCVAVLCLCCSVLQCVAVWYRVLQYVAVCCSVLQCLAVSCSVLQSAAVCYNVLQYAAVCWSVLWHSALRCSVLQCVAMCGHNFQEDRSSVIWLLHVCHALVSYHMTLKKTDNQCCSVLQCVAVHCNVLQCIAMCHAFMSYHMALKKTDDPCSWCVAVCCSVLQCVAMHCNVLQWVNIIFEDADHPWHDSSMSSGEVGGWGRVPFSRNLMSPTPRRKWYLTTGRRAHWMVLDPIPQSLPVHLFGSRPQPPTSRLLCVCDMTRP